SMTQPFLTTGCRRARRPGHYGSMREDEPMMVKVVEAKTVLVRSKLPGAEFVVNPYTGCAFGCQYCYASFIGRFVGEQVDTCGSSHGPRSASPSPPLTTV